MRGRVLYEALRSRIPEPFQGHPVHETARLRGFPPGNGFRNVGERNQEPTYFLCRQLGWKSHPREPPISTQIFLDGLDCSGLEIHRVHGQNRLTSLEGNLQMRASAGCKVRAQARQPTFEFAALRSRNINIFDYICNAIRHHGQSKIPVRLTR